MFITKISAVTSTATFVTTAVDQSLTCNIGGLDSGYPVTIAWKDPNDSEVLDTDTTNYNLFQGTVDGSGNQEALLTIKTTKLASFASQTSFTYKCSVMSSQYPNSLASDEIDVIAIVLTFGRLISKLHNLM